MKLYITADHIGISSGGGLVTSQEYQALEEFTEHGITLTVGPSDEARASGNPFLVDQSVRDKVSALVNTKVIATTVDIAHCYSGCLTETVKWLKDRKVPVTYTAAAHDVEASRQEHKSLGIKFDYPHLTVKELWGNYLEGYLLADRVITPSLHSARVMEKYGVDTKKIRVVPHGVNIPQESIASYPSIFTVGYLGAYGPDKGIRYLLEAWKQLAYKDAVLYLAGRDGLSPFVSHLIGMFGGGCIVQAGWQANTSDFYNAISLLVQPSVTEGFGLEVLESMSHGRPALCSVGAGASDCVPHSFCFLPKDSGAIAGAIRSFRKHPDMNEIPAKAWKCTATNYSWERVRSHYRTVWKELLNGR